MTSERLQSIIDQGEGISVEFKTSSIALNKDAFDSICGFLNRSGGHLILGVQNNGTINGVQEDKVQGIIDGVVANANNPQKLNPPYYVSPEVIDMKGKKVIVVYVPESSQVHATNGRIYDRNQDGDFNITNQPDQVSQLYLRKQNTYSENQVYPFVELSDFKESLFEKVRNLVRNIESKHPWLAMTNEELLRSAGLYKKDMKTGQSGYTLAAVLLFGKDETIQSVVPHYKTDAIARMENTDRYDDRDDIRTNLLDSYDRLMAFTAKHLSKKFHLINTQRINVRDNLFREVIANMLVHREYTNAFPAKFIIEANQVRAENWNKPHGQGNIDPANFSPYPKNPIIAKLFKEIGWVDELGSGVRNTYKYTALYTPGAKPTFTEGDVFEIIIPLSEKVSEETSEKVSGKTSDKIIILLKEDKERTAKELSEIIGISDRAVEKQIAKLQKQGMLERVGSDKTGYWKVNETNE